jgi:hypothetical protein
MEIEGWKSNEFHFRVAWYRVEPYLYLRNLAPPYVDMKNEGLWWLMAVFHIWASTIYYAGISEAMLK